MRTLERSLFRFFAPLILAFGCLIFVPKANAKYGAFVGVGELFQPAAVRGLIEDWEFGLYGGSAIGFGRLIVKDHWLASIGPMISGIPGNDFGIFGLVGFQTELFWGIYFRGESEILGTTNGHVKGSLDLGLAIYWGS